MNNFFSLQKSQKGFTLVEMVVSLAIFTVVAVIAVGALMKITSANRKSITLKTTINNLNFTLESMSREMRVGKDYYCSTNDTNSVYPNYDSNSYDSNPQTCSLSISNTPWLVAFRSSNTHLKASPSTETCNLIYAYRYIDTSISGAPSKFTIQKAEQSSCENGIVDTDFKDLVSPEIVFENSEVEIDVGSDIQSKAFFSFKGYSGIKEAERSYFSLQTTVSQRTSD